MLNPNRRIQHLDEIADQAHRSGQASRCGATKARRWNEHADSGWSAAAHGGAMGHRTRDATVLIGNAVATIWALMLTTEM